MMIGQGPARAHYWIIRNHYDAYEDDVRGSIGYEMIFDLLCKLDVLDENI
jgi:hypothetical protein